MRTNNFLEKLALNGQSILRWEVVGRVEKLAVERGSIYVTGAVDWEQRRNSGGRHWVQYLWRGRLWNWESMFYTSFEAENGEGRRKKDLHDAMFTFEGNGIFLGSGYIRREVRALFLFKFPSFWHSFRYECGVVVASGRLWEALIRTASL